MTEAVTGSGTPEDPWVLRTPPGTSEYRMHRDDGADPPELVCQVESTKLRYLARCLEDVPARKGYRGRFAMYVPPLLEHLGLVELEHNPRNNRLRAR